MAHAWDIVGYAYDAGTHCVDCARARFGKGLRNETARDSEGNEPHPMFASDEGGDGGDTCEDCGDTINGPED